MVMVSVAEPWPPSPFGYAQGDNPQSNIPAMVALR
jgi:hypothetical protein